MKFTPIVPMQPAGSIGGLTLYKCGLGLCMRARTYPVRVRSNAHTYACNLISVLSVYWETPLTDADRAGWGLYAYNSPLTDAYGAPRYIRGYAQYMRSNRPRLQLGLPRVDTPPTTYGYPAYTYPTFGVSSDGTMISIMFTVTDDWVTEDGAGMMLWSSGPTSPSRNKPSETYAPLALIAGSSTSPPTSPVMATPAISIPDGTLSFWIRTSVSRADGRLSGG